MQLDDVSFVIPARNEEKNLFLFAESLAKMNPGEVILVDDGSADRTFSLAKSLGWKAFRLERNRGKGYACRFGASKAGKDRIVFMDADAQFRPEDALSLVRKLEGNDIVTGVRDFSSMPLQRRISNRAARFLVNSITGKRLRDCLCGFRAVRKDSFERLGLSGDGYEFESEMIIKAARLGMKIAEAPVYVSYSGYSGMSIAKSIKLFAYLLKEWIASVIRP